jgi:hypothetical protein
MIGPDGLNDRTSIVTFLASRATRLRILCFAVGPLSNLGCPPHMAFHLVNAILRALGDLFAGCDCFVQLISSACGEIIPRVIACSGSEQDSESSAYAKSHCK